MPLSVNRRGSSGPTTGATERSLASSRSLSSTAMDRRLRGQRGREGRHDGVWLVRELPRRDPDNPPAFAHEHLISSPIPFERTAHRVEGPAVYLDHEALRAPDEIDFEALDTDVALGLWQLRLA